MIVNRTVVLEVCAETLDTCRAAAPGGAQRIELCTELAVGGLTPPADLVAAAVQHADVPVHVLLRPFADQFRYTPAIMDLLSRSMEQARQHGAAGFVLGLLQADGRVDIEHTRALVQQAHPLPVSFHRAFDATPVFEAALEDVISTGCTRLLTSGGAPDVLTGAPMLARLVQKAAGRLEIAAGGGLTENNAIEVARVTGCRHFHASLRQNPRKEPFLERLQGLASLLQQAQRTVAS